MTLTEEDRETRRFDCFVNPLPEWYPGTPFIGGLHEVFPSSHFGAFAHRGFPTRPASRLVSGDHGFEFSYDAFGKS